MINALELTLASIILTLTGEAPISAWFGLFDDIINNLIGVLM